MNILKEIKMLMSFITMAIVSAYKHLSTPVDPTVSMASADFLIKPSFDQVKNWMTWQAGAINAFITAEIRDVFNFWQECFGVFGFMELNDEQEFVIHEMSGHGMLWQSHTGCAWTPGNGFDFNTHKIETPCKIKINEQFCVADLFDTCFNHLTEWTGTGPVQMKPEGRGFVDRLIRMFSRYAVMGWIAIATAGGYFDAEKITFSKKTPAGIREFFAKGSNKCKGWLTQLKILANNGMPWLNQNPFDSQLFDTNGKYHGSILEILKSQVDSNDEIASCVVDGDISGNGVIHLVDAMTYKDFHRQFMSECIDGNCINNEMSREKKTAGGQTKWVYYVNDVPVIPVKFPEIYTKYLTGHLRFAYTTTARNIYIGGAFNGMPKVGDGLTGLLVQQNTTDATKLGMTYMAAHQLMGILFAKLDMITGGQYYHERKAIA